MEDREKWFRTNRANWDERVPIHTKGEFYDVEGFKRSGEARLRPFELREVGDVREKSLLHLQCHFGLDTLSWARLGARVTGLDFSEPAVEAARKLAREVGLEGEARFVRANVYGAREALAGERFDIVYTGFGALNWLPDIRGWARVVASLLAPGGFLYLAEFHPFADVFADDDLTVEHGYFHPPERPRVWDEPGTYADLEAETENNVTYEWNHTLGAVVTALARAGLALEFLHEHDHTLFPRWPFLVRDGSGAYRLPAGEPSLPLMYSLRARKRAGARHEPAAGP